MIDIIIGYGCDHLSGLRVASGSGLGGAAGIITSFAAFFTAKGWIPANGPLAMNGAGTAVALSGTATPVGTAVGTAEVPAAAAAAAINCVRSAGLDANKAINCGVNAGIAAVIAAAGTVVGVAAVGMAKGEVIATVGTAVAAVVAGIPNGTPTIAEPEFLRAATATADTSNGVASGALTAVGAPKPLSKSKGVLAGAEVAAAAAVVGVGKVVSAPKANGLSAAEAPFESSSPNAKGLLEDDAATVEGTDGCGVNGEAVGAAGLAVAVAGVVVTLLHCSTYNSMQSVNQ